MSLAKSAYSQIILHIMIYIFNQGCIFCNIWLLSFTQKLDFVNRTCETLHEHLMKKQVALWRNRVSSK